MNLERVIILILVLGISGAGGYYLWQWKERRAFNENLHREFVKLPEDQVVEFRWEMAKEKFSFSKLEGGQWSNEAAKAGIESRLQFLSQMTYRPFTYEEFKKISKGVVVTVALRTKDSSLWEGVWDGYRYIWTKGPLRGFGLHLENNFALSKLFYEGQFAFEARRLNWCQGQITSVNGSVGEFEVSLTHDGDTWSNQAGSLNVADWITQNCQVDVEHYFDPQMIKLAWNLRGSMNFSFVDGSSRQLALFENNLISVRAFKSADHYFFSTKLRHEIEHLAQATALGVNN